jgi:DNA-directed RNA polymerase alpha subunit
MKKKPHNQQESDLPVKLSQPARRALAGAGFTRLDQLTEVTEAEVMKLHGFGKNGLEMLRQALAAKGLSFAEGKKSKKEF